MKKLIASTLAALLFSIFSPVAPVVQAATIQEQLTQVMGQNANALRIQQLLTIKKQLEQGNAQEVLAKLAKTALAQSGHNEVNTIADALTQGNITQTATQVLRQQLEKNLTGKIAPYQKELGILATLFNHKPPVAETTLDHNNLMNPPQNYKRVINMTATAYAPGALDNGKWKNQTYVGGLVEHGVAAVDPSVIPMGTKLWVEGYGEAVADDQGSAIKGNRIDLAFNDRKEALDYGIKQVKIYVLS